MNVIDESRRRIVTTGVGSLPRRHALSDLLLARMMRQPFDANALARETTEAVAEVVHKLQSQATARQAQRQRAGW